MDFIRQRELKQSNKTYAKLAAGSLDDNRLKKEILIRQQLANDTMLLIKKKKNLLKPKEQSGR